MTARVLTEDTYERTAWGVLWHGDLQGYIATVAIESEGFPLLLFATRDAARKYINAKWDYLKDCPDLRAPPHNWRMPVPVKVIVSARVAK